MSPSLLRHPAPRPPALPATPTRPYRTAFSLQSFSLLVLALLSLVARVAAAADGDTRRYIRLFTSLASPEYRALLSTPTSPQAPQLIGATDDDSDGSTGGGGGDSVPPYVIVLIVLGVCVVAIGGAIMARRLCTVRDGRERVQPILDAITDDIGGEGRYDRDIELAAVGAAPAGAASFYRPATVPASPGTASPVPRSMTTGGKRALALTDADVNDVDADAGAGAGTGAAAMGMKAASGSGSRDSSVVTGQVILAPHHSNSNDDNEEEEEEEELQGPAALAKPMRTASTYYESMPRRPLHSANAHLHEPTDSAEGAGVGAGSAAGAGTVAAAEAGAEAGAKTGAKGTYLPV